jgi:hypothetical protein
MDIDYSSRNLLRLSEPRFQGMGKVSPRIAVYSQARTLSPELAVRILNLTAELKLGTEVLAGLEMQRPGALYSSSESSMEFIGPVSRRALNFVNDSARGHVIDFSLTFRGLLLARESTGGQFRVLPAHLAPDEWQYIDIATNPNSTQLTKSLWLHSVLEPVGYDQFIELEFQVPSGAAGWAKSFALLKSAEEKYVLGDDPGVFLQCRGMVEALEGYPKDILNFLADGLKRTQLDDLFKEAGQFFHAGRHVSQTGPNQGTFDISHADAEFALVLAKTLLAYYARLRNIAEGKEGG